MTKPLVFISYSHKDEDWKDRLLTHLGVLQEEGFLKLWDDRQIGGGEKWYKEIEEAMQAAKVAILLVSASFLTSKFIRGEEVPRLLERSEKKGLRIFPIIIKPCPWKQVKWLAKMNLRPKDGRPILGGSEFQIETDLTAIAEEIGNIIQSTLEEDGKSLTIKNYISPPLPAYPPQLKEFVTHNRGDELTKALAYLEDHSILFISGLGGIGKSTLARALVEMRPDDVRPPIWFDFGKKMDAKLEDVLEHFAGYLNTPDIARFKHEKRDAGQEDIDCLIYELQNREPVWLVFDNLEKILDGIKFRDLGIDSLFTSLRESNHNAKVIVTSRTLPILRCGESLISMVYEEKQELKGLKINDAVDYLIKNGLEDVEREELEKLANGVDGHPLALELLIPLVKKFSIKDTLKDLSMYQGQKEGTIKKARRLFDKLAGDEKELLDRISVFRRPELLGAIKAMFTDKTSKDAIGNLLDKSLLETDHKGTYWLHPLVREFSYDDLKDKREVHKLAYEYYLSLPLPETHTKKEDIQPLIEAHHHACMAQDYDAAANIIFGNNLDEDLDRWGSYRTLIELYMELLPKDHFRGKPLLSNIEIHSKVIGNLGLTYYWLGQVKKAITYHEKAFASAQEIGNKPLEGVILGRLGNDYSILGHVEKAIEYYEKALMIAQEIGDRRGEGTDLGNLGIAYKNLGQMEKAIEYYEKALMIAQEIDDRRGEGIWLGRLGNAYRNLEQVEKAIEYHEKALVIAREIGDRRGEGRHIGNLGNAYRDLGEVEKAFEYYEKALVIAQEIGDRRKEGLWLGNLGIAYKNLGQIEKAIEYYEKALVIAQEIGDRRGEGAAFNNLGVALIKENKFREALACYLLAKGIRIEIKDPNIKTTISNLNDLKDKLDEKEFEKLLAEVAPRAEEIVKKILEGTSK